MSGCPPLLAVSEPPGLGLPWLSLPWGGAPLDGLLPPGMAGEPAWLLLDELLDELDEDCDEDGLCGIGGELDGVDGLEGEDGGGIELLDEEDELVVSQALSRPARHSTTSPRQSWRGLNCLAMLRISILTLSSGVARYRRWAG